MKTYTDYLSFASLLYESTTCLNILSECIACHNKSDQGLICSVTKYVKESQLNLIAAKHVSCWYKRELHS